MAVWENPDVIRLTLSWANVFAAILALGLLKFIVGIDTADLLRAILKEFRDLLLLRTNRGALNALGLVIMFSVVVVSRGFGSPADVLKPSAEFPLLAVLVIFGAMTILSVWFAKDR